MELPDWLRGIVLLGRDGAEYRVVGVDEDGYLGVILQAAAEVTIPGDVNVTQEDSIREMQGADGATLRTVVVDASGQIIMVPRGNTGNYMAVDANGFLSSLMKGIEGANLRTIAVDASGNLISVIKGLEGANLRNIAVDDEGQMIMVLRGESGVYLDVDTGGRLSAIVQGYDAENQNRWIRVDEDGQMIMVPRGNTGNYMDVDANGFLSSLMKGIEGANLRTIAVDASGNLISVIKGLEGANLRNVAVDASGQIIIVPRGASGHYLGVDSDGYMTTVMKGTHGATLKTLAADDEGYLVAILKDNSDQWGKKISVGLAELAARLGSPISWERRGQVALIETFADGFGRAALSTSGTGAEAALDPTAFQTGGYSCKLTTGTTVNKSAGVTIYGDFSPSGRIGFEVVFSMDAQPTDIYILGKVWDGALEHHAYARIHQATNKLQVYNSTPAYADAADFQLPALAPLFCSVKLVIDIDEEKWVRLLNRGTETDLSAVATDSGAVVVHPYFSFQILAIESAAVSHTIYVDRMIVTTDEP